MGCDIHTYIEILTTINGKQTWKCADRFALNPYYDKDDKDSCEQEYEIDHVYSDRNYALFSALAGVRSYGSEVEKLDDPRGLPDDINDFIKKESEDWGIDGHSHSWVTLQELYDYQDRNNTVTVKGMVLPEQAKELDESGIAPQAWCQGTSNKSYVYRSWTLECDILARFIKPIEERARKEHCIFGEENMRVERKYAEITRIVFWFDN